MKVTIETEDLEKLLDNLSKLEDESETIVNDIMHNFGADEVTKNVMDLLPVSSRDKKHAKYSKPFKTDPTNLGFYFQTKGGKASNKTSFGYLMFPDEGRGKRNPVKQDFTKRGVEKSRPIIMRELQTIVTEKLKEVL